MTWEIVVGIIALIGFVLSIGKVVSNNTEALTEVRCSIDNLRDAFSEQKENVEHIKDEVNDHETRLTVLEHK